MRVATTILALALLTSACAIGKITRPDGTTVTGWVVGAAAIESCEPGGAIGAGSSSADGAMLGPCARLDGGSMSSTLATVLGAAISAAALYFGGGA